MVNVAEKLYTLSYEIDAKSHIIIDEKACLKCDKKPCLNICPAEMFTLASDGKTVVNSYEGCLECGTCYLVCKTLSWSYPRAGYGVNFRKV